MKVLIITGGHDSERTISLISANSVKEALESKNYTVKLFDFNQGLKELEKVLPKFDVVFPVMHGEEGEGGKLQKLLKNKKIKYVGGDPTGFKMGWYKIPFKKFCDKERIITAEWKIIKDKEDILEFGFPSVVKSSSGGSSKEVVILRSKLDLYKVNKLLKNSSGVYIEKFIDGIEVTVGILNNTALPVLEIIPPKESWFDYRNKYSGETKEIPFAPSISKSIQKKTQQIALTIHRQLNLGSYSRIDFILSNDIPICLEVNTIPGLTPQSLFPKAALAAGISFPDLVEKLIISAL